MAYVQTGEHNAGEADMLVPNAASPDDDCIVTIRYPTVGNGSREADPNNLDNEEDVGRVLGWLATEDWILLNNVGNKGRDWDVMRDKAIFAAPHFEAKRLTRYSIRCINGIIEACVLTDRDLPADTPPEPMF